MQNRTFGENVDRLLTFSDRLTIRGTVWRFVAVISAQVPI
jgi:hypothetical protein